MRKKKQEEIEVNSIDVEIEPVVGKKEEDKTEIPNENTQDIKEKRRKNEKVEKTEKLENNTKAIAEETIQEATADSIADVSVEKKTKNKGLNKVLIITAIIFVVIAIGVVTFAVVNKVNDKVYHNIHLNGVDLSGKSEAEVSEYIATLNEQIRSKNLVIKNGEKEIIEINPSTIDLAIDEIATKAMIMSYGRDKDLISNNINVLKALFKKQEIEIIYLYSEIKLNNIAIEVAGGIEGKVIDDTFAVDEKENRLVITKGKTGKNIDEVQFKQDVLDILKSSNEQEYQLKLQDAIPKELDVDVIYAKVAKAAKNAYVDETVTPAVYHKHELGITFDKNELREVLAKEENKEEGKSINFNLVTTKPEVTIQDITKHLYKDTLGEYTSSYADSGANRASNVALAAKMLNGTIVMPGETFSFNKVMGDCGLESRGFKSAAVFKQGKIEYEIGGGVCQISSTLYIAALYANMSIVTRYNHNLPVAYVPASLDATVYYPYKDFKFKNTREYPIKIVATTSSKKLTISICGTKEEVEYEIVLTSKKTGTVAPKVQKQNNSSMNVGETKIINGGSYGYTSEAYKTVKLNGKVVSKTLLSEDKYNSTPKIIAVGTKQVSVYGE